MLPKDSTFFFYQYNRVLNITWEIFTLKVIYYLLKIYTTGCSVHLLNQAIFLTGSPHLSEVRGFMGNWRGSSCVLARDNKSRLPPFGVYWLPVSPEAQAGFGSH